MGAVQVPEERGVLEHCKEQLSAYLVTAVYDHTIVANHSVTPVRSTSLHLAEDPGVPILLHLVTWCSVLLVACPC